VSTITVYRDATGEWRWRLTAANGEPIANSGEGYTRRNDAIQAVYRLVTLTRGGIASARRSGHGLLFTLEEPDA
jgi:uncharacterized protein YegP (UPF0339 family)